MYQSASVVNISIGIQITHSVYIHISACITVQLYLFLSVCLSVSVLDKQDNCEKLAKMHLDCCRAAFYKYLYKVFSLSCINFVYNL